MHYLKLIVVFIVLPLLPAWAGWEQLQRVQAAQPLGQVGMVLSGVALGGGLLAALLGAAAIWLPCHASRAARRGQPLLLAAFDGARRRLPALQALHIAAVAVAGSCAGLFEARVLLRDGLEVEALIALAPAIVLPLAAWWYSLWRIAQARRAIAEAFQPLPVVSTVLGQSLSARQAPELWALAERLALALRVPPPTHLVVGFEGRCQMTFTPVQCMPGNTRHEGRTLYVPLPLLGLLDAAEAEAALAYALACNAQMETPYGQVFLPVYVGLGSALEAADAQVTRGVWQDVLFAPVAWLHEHLRGAWQGPVSREQAACEARATAAVARAVDGLALRAAVERLARVEETLERILAIELEFGNQPGADVLTEALLELEKNAPVPVNATAAVDRYFADGPALRASLSQAFYQHGEALEAELEADLGALRQVVASATQRREAGPVRKTLAWCMIFLLLFGALASWV
ncbi:hypothetical protein [Pseudomonas sp. NPDC007930]|uniref:hypothetical protein n=1 Tax=Pseudomonas sp. NPDC007930 TaxID=3364417 RepID=UPI0036E67268